MWTCQRCCAVPWQGTALLPGAGLLHMAAECAGAFRLASSGRLALVSVAIVSPLRLSAGQSPVWWGVCI